MAWVRIVGDLAALLAAGSAAIALLGQPRIRTSVDETGRVTTIRMTRLQRTGLWLAAFAGLLAIAAVVGNLLR